MVRVEELVFDAVPLWKIFQMKMEHVVGKGRGKGELG